MYSLEQNVVSLTDEVERLQGATSNLGELAVERFKQYTRKAQSRSVKAHGQEQHSVLTVVRICAICNDVGGCVPPLNY